MSIIRGEVHIDLDHVVFPFHHHFKEHMPEPVDVREIEDYTKLDIVMGMTPSEVYRLIRQFLEHPNSQTIKPIDGAKEAYNSLVSQGLPVRYVTAREPSTEDATRAWLETHITEGEEPTVLFTGSNEGVGSKQEAFTLHRPIAVVDDSPKHIIEAISAGVGLPILFGDYPWTKTKPENSMHARDWHQTLEIVLT